MNNDDNRLVGELLAEAHAEGGADMLADVGGRIGRSAGRGEDPWGIGAAMCTDLEQGDTTSSDRVLRRPESLWRSWIGTDGSTQWLGDYLPAIAAAHTTDAGLCRGHLDYMKGHQYSTTPAEAGIIAAIAIDRDYDKAKQLTGATLGRIVPDSGPESPLVDSVIIPGLFRMAALNEGSWMGAGQPSHRLRDVRASACRRYFDNADWGDIENTRTSVLIDLHLNHPAVLEGGRSKAVRRAVRQAMRSRQLGDDLRTDGGGCPDDVLGSMLTVCGWDGEHWSARLEELERRGIEAPAAMAIHAGFIARKQGLGLGPSIQASLRTSMRLMSAREDRHAAVFLLVGQALLEDPVPADALAEACVDLFGTTGNRCSAEQVLKAAVQVCIATSDRIVEAVNLLCVDQGRWLEGLTAGRYLGLTAAVSVEGIDPDLYDDPAIPNHTMWTVCRRDTIPDSVVAERIPISKLQSAIQVIDERNTGWFRRRMLLMLLKTAVDDPTNATSRLTLLRRTFWDSHEKTCAEYADFLRNFYSRNRRGRPQTPADPTTS